MPRCPNGSRINKKTGLCESKTKKTTPKQKTNSKNTECPPGKILNPKTTRCIQNTAANRTRISLLVKQPETKQICPPGKKLNSKTNVCKITTKTLKKTNTENKIEDVLSNLITINGHGSYNTQKIKVPKGFQVLIPHRNGLDQDYTTPDAGKDKLYEETMYKNKYLNYRDGWKLYLPGDDINNLKVSTFHDASSCNTINKYHLLQKPLIEKCKKNVSFNKFCPLYCTKKEGNDFTYITYKNKRKLKIKACSNFDLNYLFKNLKQALKKIPNDNNISPIGEPIVLIPFTCNAKSNSRLIPFDRNNKTKLNTIYQELIKHR
tara:strand:+ start:4027 stop:4983 length:957 start_codon:yes stop_codon:yes gene_type:complete